jgi:N-acetylmuramoyl-L-alanine amidase
MTTDPPGEPPPVGVLRVGADGVDLRDEPGGAQAGRIRAGVVLPYSKRRGDWLRVTTPCDRDAWAPVSAGSARGPYRVVVDPGHGGDEPGAVGSGGLTEAELNLDIGERVVRGLGAKGIRAVSTRTGDYRATLAFRVRVAIDAGAEVFVSLHHNAEPDEERATPGTEAYFQYRSPESKRLTGLVQEEVYRAFSHYDVRFAADYDAGAKWRLSGEGDDYYGVIRRTFEAGIAATLSEAAFVSNPEEETLLRRDDVRQAEADAVVTAIERYFAGERPGDVFTEPYLRTTPAGGGGGAAGCVDPS